MKRKYLVFGVLAAGSFWSAAQSPTDSLYGKRKVSKTDIQLVYSQYIQNGNHSAITGGTGTEKLLVYSPDLTITHQIDSAHGYAINAGVDIITSASLDNIDFVMSSASRVSKHGFIDLSYTQGFRNSRLRLTPSGYFSIESAYLSQGLGLSLESQNKEKTRIFSADIQTFFDDLRWGRLNGERPLKLVYPVELRYKQWFSAYLRQSYNLTLEWQQTLNRRMILGIFPGFAYQHGLLATPYHRVYFTDSTEKVENLPPDRWKIPLGIQLNSFVGTHYILEAYYRFYWDNFGIWAHTLELGLGIKTSASLTLTPILRLYTQTAARSFRPYREHDPSEKYYTSNYDLAAFQSYEVALEARISGAGHTGPGTIFKECSFRYSYYHRTDGLDSHILTLLTGVSHRPKPASISAF